MDLGLDDLFKGNNNKYILIDNQQRLLFFKKIIVKYKVENFYFLHANLSTYLNERNNNKKSNILLKKGNKFSTTVDCIENYIGYEKQKYFYEIIGIKKDTKFDLWIFNGFQFNAKNILEDLKDKTLNVWYFEIGNFSNKIQVGINGINADNKILSQIKKIKKIKKYPKINYFENKIDGVEVSLIKKSRSFLLNYYGYFFLKTLSPKRSLMSLVNEYFNRIRCVILFKKIKNQKINTSLNYAVFIGQVSRDTQTIFQSEESTISLLKKAEKICLDNKVKMVVRLHPRENYYNALKETYEFCRNRNILIDNNTNLHKLISKSSLLITCNSTLGCQSLSLNKKVITLGNAFYENWNKIHLEYYYNELLIDV